MIGESSYDIISHITSMENRLMHKLSDSMEVQESHYVEMKEIMAQLAVRLSCRKSDSNDIVDRSRPAAVTVFSRQSGFSMLQQVRPVGSSKIMFLASKRRPALKSTGQSLKKIGNDAEVLYQRTAHLAIQDDTSPTFNAGVNDSNMPGNVACERVSTEVEPADDSEAEAVVESSVRCQTPIEIQPEDGAARSAQSWLRTLVSIKDSAAVFHKDFRAAR
jgi:hypothetical protein